MPHQEILLIRQEHVVRINQYLITMQSNHPCFHSPTFSNHLSSRQPAYARNLPPPLTLAALPHLVARHRSIPAEILGPPEGEFLFLPLLLYQNQLTVVIPPRTLDQMPLEQLILVAPPRCTSGSLQLLAEKTMLPVSFAISKNGVKQSALRG